MSWSLFGKLVRMLVKERLEYRADFLLNALAQSLQFVASYTVIWMVIRRFDSIGGWYWPEIALLYSICLFTYAIGAAFSLVQMRELESHVRNGTFDTVLVKPEYCRSSGPYPL